MTEADFHSNAARGPGIPELTDEVRPTRLPGDSKQDGKLAQIFKRLAPFAKPVYLGDPEADIKIYSGSQTPVLEIDDKEVSIFIFDPKGQRYYPGITVTQVSVGEDGERIVERERYSASMTVDGNANYDEAAGAKLSAVRRLVSGYLAVAVGDIKPSLTASEAAEN